MKVISKTVYLLLLSLLISSTAVAQLEDGRYYAFRTVKPDQQPDVITIQVLSIGDKVRQFTDEFTKKGLEGEYHIAISHSRYAIADFKKGLLNGNWVQYWNNEVEEKGGFKNGKYDGPFWAHTSEGHTDYVYDNGKLVSSKALYDNGQLRYESPRDENGQLHGEVIDYNRDGSINSRHTYVHGVQEGPQYKTRQMVETYTLKNGKKVGEYSSYTHSGGLFEKGTFDDNGIKIGTWQYGNGTKEISKEESYRNGKIHGIRKRFYSNGNLWHYEEFEDGKRHGKSVDYERDDNNPTREYHYRNDKKHGEFKVYYNGKLERSGLYKDDQLVMEKHYHDGKLSEVRLLDETGNLTRVEGYNNAGQKTYRNTTFKKHPSITLKESSSGVIDIEIE